MQTATPQCSDERKRNQGKRSNLSGIANFFLLTLVFSIAYTQSPLYTSNQNQYFLHGLAAAGRGYLKQDWLANTLDPTPVFSLLVEVTARFLRLDAFFYIIFALLMGVYLFSLLGIVSQYFDIRRSRTRYMAYVAVLVVVHSAGLRFALSRLFGPNWAYVLEDGVADQRLIGQVLQPSAFGVLLLFSIYLFLRRRPYLAVLAATLAATIHPTYLLSAAALTAAYMLIAWMESEPVTCIRVRSLASLSLGAFALACVLPILTYVYTNFGSTPAETTAQARQILVNYRIPHHAQIDWWLDATVAVKLALIAAALYSLRRKRLFWILLVPTVVALGLTLIQVFTGSYTLALLFPWRLSTFIVPLATAVLLARLIVWLFERFSHQIVLYAAWIRFGAISLLTAAFLVGGIRLMIDFDRKANIEERPLLDYVAANHQPDEIYLTPVKMQDFRLAAGSPVYVDFKSIPYRDSDVLEWYRRMQLADRFYIEKDCGLLFGFALEGVTHLVIPTDGFDQPCSGLRPIYQDIHYTLYTLQPSG